MAVSLLDADAVFLILENSFVRSQPDRRIPVVCKVTVLTLLLVTIKSLEMAPG